MECSYKSPALSLKKHISKEKVRRHVFVVHVTHCQNLGAIRQIPYEFFLVTVSASSEKIDSRNSDFFFTLEISFGSLL